MVSIVIPVYNVEKYLRQCLDSVLAQTYSDLEVIAVDDGSTDSSPSVCDEYAARDPRVRVIHKPNEGVSAARNTGVEFAHGEWMTFVDADDMLAPDAVEHWMRTAQETGVLCITACISRKAAKVMHRHKQVKPRIYDWESLTARSLHQLRGTDTGSWAKLLHRSVFAGTLRWPDGYRFEDLALLPLLYERIGELGSKIASLNMPLYFYRPVSGSFMDSPCNPAYADLFRVTEEIENWATHRSYALLRAARNRRFAAACAMIPYAHTFYDKAITPQSLWHIAKFRRSEILLTPVTRIKTRIAAVLTLMGRNIWQRAMTRYLSK